MIAATIEYEIADHDPLLMLSSIFVHILGLDGPAILQVHVTELPRAVDALNRNSVQALILFILKSLILCILALAFILPLPIDDAGRHVV